MKQFFLITLILLHSLYAQSSDFSVVIDKPFNAALLDVTEDYDRTISAIGYTKNFTANQNQNQTFTNPFDYLASVSRGHGSQIHLLKVSNKAKIALSKTTNLTQFNEAVALVKTPQNGYIIGGYTLDGSLLILKLDTHGNIIFNRQFGTKNYDRMNNLILMSDGGVLAIGSSITSRSTNDAMFETGLGLNDIYLTRFSKNGTKLWSKKYGTQYDDRGIDAVEAYDGSIVVISTTSYDKNKDVTLMRITENGNKIWLKHYKNKTLTIPHKIIKLRDNNFVVSLSQYDAMQKEQIRLIKFDLYKNVLLDKDIHTTYPSVLKDIKEFSDGSFMGVGYVKDTYNTDALVMVLDSNLEMMNQEHYGDENYDLFNALSILHNSQVAAVGIHTNKDSQESNMWLVKLNRDGTMAQIPQNTPKILAQLRELFAQEIQKKKILIKEDLNIELIDKSLYFQVGEYQLSQAQKEFLKSFGDKLSHFIVQLKAQIANLEINGHTSSEWKGTNFRDTYLNNAKLSTQRAYTTLAYIFTNQKTKVQKTLIPLLKESGYSYAKSIAFNNKEDKVKSRRVSFKIILK